MRNKLVAWIVGLAALLLAPGLASAGAFIELVQSPTVTASSAYASGNWVGGLLTFTGVGNTGRVEEVTVYSKSAQTAEIDLWWCEGSNPASTTVTDKTAVAIAAADFSKCRVVAQLTNWQSGGTPSVATTGQLASPFAFSAGTTGYGFLVTRGTPTFASTSDLTVQLHIGR